MNPPASSNASPARRFLLLGLVSLALGTIYAVVLWRTQSHAAGDGDSVLSVAADSPESFRTIAPFSLRDSTGAEVTRETLMGKPWIASFVFTRCTGPCPRVTASMHRAQELLEGSDVRLVTVTVDPEYDTPEILAAYARSVGADTHRWSFLTGDPDAVRKVSYESFLLPIDKSPDKPVGESIVHRTSLVVVDAAGVVRGYYDGETDAGVDQAVARARWLAGHGAPAERR